jgi:hypothetical protein
MKRLHEKKHGQSQEFEHVDLSQLNDPVQNEWFNELRSALSPYWSARAEHTNKKALYFNEKDERPHAA